MLQDGPSTSLVFSGDVFSREHFSWSAIKIRDAGR